MCKHNQTQTSGVVLEPEPNQIHRLILHSPNTQVRRIAIKCVRFNKLTWKRCGSSKAPFKLLGQEAVLVINDAMQRAPPVDPSIRDEVIWSCGAACAGVRPHHLRSKAYTMVLRSNTGLLQILRVLQPLLSQWKLTHICHKGWHSQISWCPAKR